MLQRLPGYFQQEALLGVHARRFARRNAEEVGVEAVDLFQEAAPARGHFARRSLRVVEGVHVPAPGRHLADGVDAVAQQAPEGVRTVRPGEAAAEADHGDRLIGGGRRRGSARAFLLAGQVAR